MRQASITYQLIMEASRGCPRHHRGCRAGMTSQRTYHALNRSMLQTWLQQISFTIAIAMSIMLPVPSARGNTCVLDTS